jgi:hypothetical protein
MKAKVLACVLAAMLLASPLQAAVMNVFGGVHDLLPNTPGQVIDVMVTGDGLVDGLNFYAMVGSGLTDEVPNITDVDLIGPGTLFGPNNDGQDDTPGLSYGYGGLWIAETLTKKDNNGNTTYVTPDPAGSVLGRITIDTTNYTTGSFVLFLKDVDLGDLGIYSTDFAGWEDIAGNTLTIENGTLNIVPEPSSVLLMLAGIAGLGVVTVVRRKRSV